MTSLHTLEAKARRHWKEFLPEMTADLKAEGMWEQKLRSSAFAAQSEIKNLMAQGYQEHEAEEVVLPQLILLKPEPGADSPDWEQDELAKKEAEYQAMMREPDEDEDE